MGEKGKNKALSKSWFKGLQSEFRKIKWPDKGTIGKQAVAVIVVSVILGVIIAVVDLGIQNGVDFLVNL